MLLNNSSYLFSAAFPHGLQHTLFHFILPLPLWASSGRQRGGPVLSSTLLPSRNSMCSCWRGLAGQLEGGNYLFSLSGFPKMSWVFNARLGTESSLAIVLSTVLFTLPLRAIESGISTSPGGTGSSLRSPGSWESACYSSAPAVGNLWVLYCFSGLSFLGYQHHAHCHQNSTRKICNITHGIFALMKVTSSRFLLF